MSIQGADHVNEGVGKKKKKNKCFEMGKGRETHFNVVIPQI